MEEKEIEENWKEYNELLDFCGANGKDIKVYKDFIAKSDMKIASASAFNHNNVKGGLVAHCLNVYKNIKLLTVAKLGERYWQDNEATLTFLALVHDTSKINYYEFTTRNVKNEATGAWEKEPFIKAKSQEELLPHEEMCAYAVNAMVKLTREEFLAIRYHGGGFSCPGGTPLGKCCMNVFAKYKNAYLLHLADNMAASVDEASFGGKPVEETK